MWAAQDGDLEKVRKLLDDHADVNFKGDWGLTPLHLASLNGHLDIVQELLARGASVNAANNVMQEMVERHCILLRGTDILDVVQELLARGASADVANNFGMTALHRASKEGELEILKVLLDAGANTHLKNEDGKTARDLGSGKVKAFFDDYFQPSISCILLLTRLYSIQSATGLIHETLEDTNGKTSNLVVTGSAVLNLSLRVKIHRQQVLAIGVLVADVLRHTTHQDSPSEQQALVSVLKNIQTYFQSNLTAFQP
ncbi:hypothetical protein Ae201684_015998 [Aphanomyces euteiches]|uniref:Uncharacterized protein n=1 Tax=Aphanomyces euteiches TaxID=100861 RepID=A0A6G0WG24_9STRA|nr:hypothetical protein Ae201684_015998 [Aphanomyces euteiches]